MNESRGHSQFPKWFVVLMAPVIAVEKIKDALKSMKGGKK